MDPKFKMEMLEKWLKRGLLTDDTFQLLTLGNAVDDLLDGSLLSAWVTYIKVFNKENPTEQLSIVATLTARFGDEALSTMIETAKKVRKTAAVAYRVQDELIRLWLDARKRPDEIFVLLKLNTAKSQLFDQLPLSTWVTFVDAFNAANPKKATTLFSVLEPLYSDEALTQMLVIAKTFPGSETIAIRIQAEQTQFWLRVNKRPDDVFRLLKLHKLGTTFISNSIFRAWVKYTDEFRKRNPGTKLTTLSTLRKFYTDATLARLFVHAGESADTANIGKRMEAELVREWAITVTPPVRVFELLQLRSEAVKLFQSPLYTLWTDYLVFIQKTEPAFKSDVVPMLRKIYGDQNLARLLIAAKKMHSTNEMAVNMQRELFGLWRAANVHPKQVYNMLWFDKVAENSTARAFFSEYAKFYANPTSIRSANR